ncbi:unnamed protein product [Discosporangium mesarthrocarpum]
MDAMNGHGRSGLGRVEEDRVQEKDDKYAAEFQALLPPSDRPDQKRRKGEKEGKESRPPEATQSKSMEAQHEAPRHEVNHLKSSRGGMVSQMPRAVEVLPSTPRPREDDIPGSFEGNECEGQNRPNKPAQETSSLGPVGREVMRPWKKVLYERQPFPDNYVPAAFLEKMVTNGHARNPDIRLYVANAFAVTQQISVVTLFLYVFLHTADGMISAEEMITMDILLLFGAYATMFFLSPKGKVKARDPNVSQGLGLGFFSTKLEEASQQKGHLAGKGKCSSLESQGTPPNSGGGSSLSLEREQCAGVDKVEREDLDHLSTSSTLTSSFLFLGILRVMTPVLRTLTVSYADDTVYALAVTLSFLHLAFYDYSYANTASRQFQGTLSLNAAIGAAVLLASRLESNELVFGLVLFAAELFAVFPLARREVKQFSIFLHVALTAAMVLASGLLLYGEHKTLFFAYSLTVVFVTVACPLWLMNVQRYKLRIEGPWDIAHIDASGIL